jgi:NAD(P)-dependent dehydrogenase (short-subunit alcohol dehydrogenase family)
MAVTGRRTPASQRKSFFGSFFTKKELLPYLSSMSVIVVTGGARGIGAGIVEQLRAEGHRVIAVDIDGGDERCDVSDEAQVNVLMENIAAREGRLDGLVCNAGFMIRKPIGALSFDEWQRVIGTNLSSTFLLVKAAERLLREAKGAIVTIASTRAHMSEPNTESYAASKGGLLALTHALAVSLRPDVRVNCISPGWIDTQSGELSEEDHAQHPAGRVGRVEDVAALASFLLGDKAGFVTGAEFIVDGGMTRKMIYAA